MWDCVCAWLWRGVPGCGGASVGAGPCLGPSAVGVSPLLAPTPPPPPRPSVVQACAPVPGTRWQRWSSDGRGEAGSSHVNRPCAACMCPARASVHTHTHWSRSWVAWCIWFACQVAAAGLVGDEAPPPGSAAKAPRATRHEQELVREALHLSPMPPQGVRAPALPTGLREFNLNRKRGRRRRKKEKLKGSNPKQG